MELKDRYGHRITINQARNGSIIIPFGERNITLSKKDAEYFSLYDIEDFDIDLFSEYYSG